MLLSTHLAPALSLTSHSITTIAQRAMAGSPSSRPTRLAVSVRGQCSRILVCNRPGTQPRHCGITDSGLVGGPGASGIKPFDAFSAAFLDWTGGFYDVVSWDPRGSGSLTM